MWALEASLILPDFLYCENGSGDYRDHSVSLWNSNNVHNEINMEGVAFRVASMLIDDSMLILLARQHALLKPEYLLCLEVILGATSACPMTKIHILRHLTWGLSINILTGHAGLGI